MPRIRLGRSQGILFAWLRTPAPGCAPADQKFTTFSAQMIQSVRRVIGALDSIGRVIDDQQGFHEILHCYRSAPACDKLIIGLAASTRFDLDQLPIKLPAYVYSHGSAGRTSSDTQSTPTCMASNRTCATTQASAQASRERMQQRARRPSFRLEAGAFRFDLCQSGGPRLA